MCNREKNRRGFSPTAMCTICGDQCEDVDHVLRKCVNAREVWHHVFPPDSPMRDMSGTFNDWFDCVVTGRYGGRRAKEWKARYVATLWWIWKWRNKQIFSQESWDVRSKATWLRQVFRETEIAFEKALGPSERKKSEKRRQ